MGLRFDEKLMVQVAQMYYIDGMTQSTIAKQFGLSRASICMMLSDAREYGIVEINIKHPKNYNNELSEQLMSIYVHLNKCFVIPTSVTSINMLTKIIASQGAYIAEEEIASNQTIGVAWGLTTFEFMSSFINSHDLGNIEVVPLIGGTNRMSSEYQLNEMVRQFAEKLNGTSSFIHAPAYAESVKDRELYMKSQSMQSIIEKWSSLDVAVVSVGSMPEYYDKNIIFDNNALFDPFVIKEMFHQNEDRAVGDICGRRLNIKGSFLDCEHNQKLIAIDGKNLAATKKVICIAAGRHKVLSIIGALRTKTINMLVTDEATAKTVLAVSSQLEI